MKFKFIFLSLAISYVSLCSAQSIDAPAWTLKQGAPFSFLDTGGKAVKKIDRHGSPCVLHGFKGFANSIVIEGNTIKLDSFDLAAPPGATYNVAPRFMSISIGPQGLEKPVGSDCGMVIFTDPFGRSIREGFVNLQWNDWGGRLERIELGREGLSVITGDIYLEKEHVNVYAHTDGVVFDSTWHPRKDRDKINCIDFVICGSMNKSYAPESAMIEGGGESGLFLTLKNMREYVWEKSQGKYLPGPMAAKKVKLGPDGEYVPMVEKWAPILKKTGPGYEAEFFPTSHNFDYRGYGKLKLIGENWISREFEVSDGSFSSAGNDLDSFTAVLAPETPVVFRYGVWEFTAFGVVITNGSSEFLRAERAIAYAGDLLIECSSFSLDFDGTPIAPLSGLAQQRIAEPSGNTESGYEGYQSGHDQSPGPAFYIEKIDPVRATGSVTFPINIGIIKKSIKLNKAILFPDGWMSAQLSSDSHDDANSERYGRLEKESYFFEGLKLNGKELMISVAKISLPISYGISPLIIRDLRINLDGTIKGSGVIEPLTFRGFIIKPTNFKAGGESLELQGSLRVEKIGDMSVDMDLSLSSCCFGGWRGFQYSAFRDSAENEPFLLSQSPRNPIKLRASQMVLESDRENQVDIFTLYGTDLLHGLPEADDWEAYEARIKLLNGKLAGMAISLGNRPRFSWNGAWVFMDKISGIRADGGLIFNGHISPNGEEPDEYTATRVVDCVLNGKGFFIESLIELPYRLLHNTTLRRRLASNRNYDSIEIFGGFSVRIIGRTKFARKSNYGQGFWYKVIDEEGNHGWISGDALDVDSPESLPLISPEE